MPVSVAAGCCALTACDSAAQDNNARAAALAISCLQRSSALADIITHAPTLPLPDTGTERAR